MKRWLLAVIGAVIPLNRLRIAYYRGVMGYDIAADVYIAPLNLIDVDELKFTGCIIGPFNMFRGPFSLEIQKGSTVGRCNSLICGDWVLDPTIREGNFVRRCVLGENTLITSFHFIDVVGGVEIGAGTWLAGRSTQIWTHGAGVAEMGVRIGEQCYIGSASRFSPGSAVGSESIVAMASVVTKKFIETNVLLGGVPAKVLKEAVELPPGVRARFEQ